MRLGSDLEELLAPQRRLDELCKRTVLRAGAELADLGYANMYDGPPSEVLDALRGALDDLGTLDLQYTPYGGAAATRRAVAQQLAEESGLDYAARDVVLTPGAMAALNVVFRALREVETGAVAEAPEAIVPTPCWLDYPLYLRNLGFEVRLVPVERATLRLDLAALAEALSPRTRMVVLMQPANPTGLSHGEAELRALVRLLEARDDPPWIVCDESQRGVRLDERAIASPAALWPRTCVVHSFGKSLRMQGQRIGYAAVSPLLSEREDFVETLEALCRVMGFCTPTALMQRALRVLVRHVPDWSALRRRRGIALEALGAGGYEVVPSDATPFLYPRTPEEDDWSHAERLADAGVLVAPAPVFHHRGHFRISLTCTDAMLERAAEVFARGGRR